MKKLEAKFTTQLMKVIDGQRFTEPVWGEAKVVERPRRFSTKVLSPKAKTLLQYTKLKYKFSDAARMGTPLDFIYLPSVHPLLCVLWYGKGQKTIAYFFKYDGGEYLLSEDEARSLAVKIIEI